MPWTSLELGPKITRCTRRVKAERACIWESAYTSVVGPPRDCHNFLQMFPPVRRTRALLLLINFIIVLIVLGGRLQRRFCKNTGGPGLI